MDDTCTALPQDFVEPFHKHLNSIDPNIQFTVEKESGGQLPSLDVLMTREKDDTLSTDMYRKAMHTQTRTWTLIPTT